MLNSKNIGDKIAEARKKVNISQAKLAEMLFISPQAVGKWERGESLPDIVTLNRLAEIMGVDLNYFSDSFTADSKASENGVQMSDNAAAIDNQTKKPSWNMSSGNWIDVDFSGLKNLHEKFSASNIQKCLFVGSELAGLSLRGNNIDACDFSDSDISDSQIQNSNISNSQFNNCSLRNTEFLKSFNEGCDFSGADFTGVKFKSGGIGNCKVESAIWNASTFNAMYISDITFEGTIEDCSFENCSFTRVTFQNVNFINTFFKNNRKMKNVKFINCKADKLSQAFLKSEKANLE